MFSNVHKRSNVHDVKKMLGRQSLCRTWGTSLLIINNTTAASQRLLCQSGGASGQSNPGPQFSREVLMLSCRATDRCTATHRHQLDIKLTIMSSPTACHAQN